MVRINASRYIIAGLGIILLLVGYQAAHALVDRANGAGAAHTAGHQIRQPFADGNGLVAWYPFDSNGNDASGNGYNASPVVVSGSYSYTKGVFGNAFTINGVSDLGMRAADPLSSATNWTLSAWVNLSCLCAGAGQSQIIEVGNQTSNGFGLEVYNSGGQVGVLYDGVAFDSSGSYINTNQWYYLTAVNNAGTLTMYVNGVAAPNTFSNTPTAPTTYLTIGAEPNGSTDFTRISSGSIDDARVYNRPLSQAEITSLYQGSQPVTCDQTCLGYWKFDETSGSAAQDSVNNGKTEKYDRALTINHTKVPNTDQSNFPVLVSVTDATLATVAHGGNVQNSNGYDIEFYSDSSLTTKLNWEMESYNATTGAIVAWVKIPTVSHTADTTFYMTYDDSTVSTFQGNIHGTWDSNFMTVYHLGDGSTLSTTDSTSNANTINNDGATAGSGEVSGGAAMTLNHYMTTGTSGLPLTSGFSPNFNVSGKSITFSSWVYFSSVTSTNQWVFETPVSGGNESFYMWWTSNNQYSLGTDDLVIGWNIGGSTYHDHTFAWTPTANTWYQLATTYDGTTLTAYVNGASIGSTTDASGPVNSNGALTLGTQNAQNATPDHLEGSLDEFRYSTSLRSADWIATEYNTESSPSTFITLGSQVSAQNNNGTLTGFSFTAGTDGWTSGVFGNGLQFNGSSDYITTNNQVTVPATITESAWFKTTAAQGAIVGFCSTVSPTDCSGGYDRTMYINTSGQITFGVYNSGYVMVTSPTALNDGNWHLATVTLDDAVGETLYIDGQQVAFTSNMYSPPYAGYWHIGAVKLQYWPGAGSIYFNGTLDDVRVYNRVLNASEVYDMYSAGH